MVTKKVTTPTENVIFWVNVQPDVVLIRIKGRASYLNCHAFSKFVEKMLNENRFSFCFFLEDCVGMDSTFWGIIAKVAIKARQLKSVCILSGLKAKQLESIHNLGLYDLVQVVENIVDSKLWANGDSFTIEGQTSIEDTRELILKAHKVLMQLNEQNTVRFQDVVHFLT